MQKSERRINLRKRPNTGGVAATGRGAPEKKCVCTPMFRYPIDNLGLVSYGVNFVHHGYEPYQRIGTEIKVCEAELEGWIRPKLGLDVADYRDNVVRVVLVYDLFPDPVVDVDWSTVFTDQDYLGTETSDVFSGVNEAYRERFQILYDKQLYLDQPPPSEVTMNTFDLEMATPHPMVTSTLVLPPLSSTTPIHSSSGVFSPQLDVNLVGAWVTPGPGGTVAGGITQNLVSNSTINLASDAAVVTATTPDSDGSIVQPSYDLVSAIVKDPEGTISGSVQARPFFAAAMKDMRISWRDDRLALKCRYMDDNVPTGGKISVLCLASSAIEMYDAQLRFKMWYYDD